MLLTYITMQERELFLGLILPERVLEYFDIKGSSKTKEKITVLLEEKNNPPVPKGKEGKKITSKGFTDITITDFPIRGRKTLLTFRRRYWQIEGEKELLKRDIKLCAEGTQLEKEFGNFLKGTSGEVRSLFDEYC